MTGCATSSDHLLKVNHLRFQSVGQLIGKTSTLKRGQLIGNISTLEKGQLIGNISTLEQGQLIGNKSSLQQAATDGKYINSKARGN